LSKKDQKEEYIIVDLSDALSSPIGQRSQKAVALIRKAVTKRFKVPQVNIDPYLNSKIWARSRSRPPRRIKIEVTVEDDVAHVVLG